MINLQGPGSLKKMVGICGKEVVRIPNLLFARKHLTNVKEPKNVQKIKHLFAFVSSPKIYQDHIIINKAKGWCHAFRKPKKFLPAGKPQIFLPESDFMDVSFVPMAPKSGKRYDFFYYTLNSRAGIRYKGLEFFCECINILCNTCKLRGLVVVYFPNVPRARRFNCLPEKYRNLLNNPRLTFYWGKMNDEQMAMVAAESRFGFFPNIIDNSPRTISETLIRDVPILLNEKIHGGWHYINDETGHLFNKDNLIEKIELMLKRTYHPREYFMKHYGFKKSTKKLAEFVQSIVKLDKCYNYMYFHRYSHFLEKIKDKLL